jgi:hypothetical protein
VREHCRYLLGKTEKAGRATIFSVLASSSFHRFDRALHMMSFPYCIFFFLKKKKKNWGEFAEFFCLAYQILHVFSPDISIHYALIYFA